MASGEVRAEDMTEETSSTLSGNEQFVMFDSVEGKRCDIDVAGNYITGDKANLQTTEKGSIVGAINEVKGETTDLKEDLYDITGNKVIEWIDDYYIATNGSTVDVNTKVPNGSYRYAVISCGEGDKFTLNCTGATTPRPWAFISSNGNVLSNASSSELVASNLVITAPTNTASLVLNDKKTNLKSYYGDLVDKQISDLRNAFQSDIKRNCYELLANVATPISRTSSGVTYSWNGMVCTVTGTSSAQVTSSILPKSMPEGFAAGQNCKNSPLRTFSSAIIQHWLQKVKCFSKKYRQILYFLIYLI